MFGNGIRIFGRLRQQAGKEVLPCRGVRGIHGGFCAGTCPGAALRIAGVICGRDIRGKVRNGGRGSGRLYGMGILIPVRVRIPGSNSRISGNGTRVSGREKTNAGNGAVRFPVQKHKPFLLPVIQCSDDILLRLLQHIGHGGQSNGSAGELYMTQKAEINLYERAAGPGHIGIDKNIGNGGRSRSTANV